MWFGSPFHSSIALYTKERWPAAVLYNRTFNIFFFTAKSKDLSCTTGFTKCEITSGIGIILHDRVKICKILPSNLPNDEVS